MFLVRLLPAKREQAPSPSRRRFLGLTSGLLLARRTGIPQTPTHANVAELDRANILVASKAAFDAPVQPPPSPRFHTETEPNLTTAGATPQPKLLRADADALRSFSNTVAALAAGFLLTHGDTYAQRAVAHVRTWLVAPATRLEPSFDQAGCAAGGSTGTPMGVVDLLPLAEAARALSFFTDALTADELGTIQAWFTEALHWLGTNRQALIAQDAKDHRASAHLLLTAASARFVRDESSLEDARKRLRTHTLRNQIRPDGVFPQEVATPNPYRNTLFNFDLLAGACQLLSSPFDLLWEFRLIDEVGLRSAAAYLYPPMARPERWPFPADAQHFRDLPGRRPALLFAGRAYNRPEYVDSWLTTPATAPPEEIAYSFPIRQPALWTARAPHGL